MPGPLARTALVALVACLAAPLAAGAAPERAGLRLQVEVVGLPGDVGARVIVTGPRDVRTTLTASATLEVLAPGAYTIAASPVRLEGVFVDSLYEPERGSLRAVVAPGKPATVTVRYRLRGGSGLLWMAAANDKAVVGFTSSELGAGGKAAGRKVSDGGRTTRGLAFDANGDLWISGDCSGTLSRLPAAQLAASGARQAAVVLKPAGPGRCLDGLAIGRDGRLWAADRASGQLLGFSPAQLARSGAVAPEVVIQSPDPKRPKLRNPCGLAFDARQNLWVSNTDGGDSVVMYAPAQLAASGSPEPTVVLTSSGNRTLSSPRGLAFDASGNLWVANRYGPIARFTPEQLKRSGSPEPAAALAVAGIARQTELVGLAFDEDGNLWVSNRVNPARLAMFRAAEVARTGAAPAAFVDGTFAAPGHLALSLPPRALPVAPAEDADADEARAGAGGPADAPR
ncbi:NHL repeat-containing protein [Anaeromyxobacter sp. Fw109-5]|uniref:Vgb family protein n=1 Tax=Anaeromyxobacter sp. (strain Fw109-5) TaxID=404589 RepID=UPI000158A7FF|nr:NHL repeat-containing protein [Anaeromyxobacter sp. Fw109-5]ABS28117.1 NHL repeat protein [Anaeromyxobacter sp. Fw109-5]